MTQIVIPHGAGDPGAALTHIGLPALFNTQAEDYLIEIPDDREADFMAALALDPAAIWLDRARADRLAELADVRWRETQAFTYDGVTAPADSALSAVVGFVVAAQMAPPEGPTTWKLAPGEFRSWTLEQIVAYGIAIRAHIQACFDHEQALTTAIQSAEDQAALDAIDLSVGWP